MLLWSILFVCCLGIFLPAGLVWHRVKKARRHQQMLAGIQAAIDPQKPIVTTRSLLEEPAAKSGIRVRLAENPRIRLILLTAVLTGGGFLVGTKLSAVIGPSALVICSVAMGALPSISRGKQRRKRLGAIEQQFPDALDFLARSVRAGNAFSIGLELLGAEASEPLKSEVLKVTREIALGSSLEDALNGLIARVPLVEIRFFVSAVLLQRETGGNLGEVMGKLSISVRERLRLRGHVKAASGQGRLTAIVLTVLPVATLLMLKLASPDYMNALTEDPIGRNLLAGAVVSQILGYLVMKKIINIEA